MTANTVAWTILFGLVACWVALGLFWIGGEIYFAWKYRALDKRIEWILAEAKRQEESE